MPRDDDKPLDERVEALANVVYGLDRTIREDLLPQITNFSTTADVQERVSGLRKFIVGMALAVLVISVGITAFSTHNVNKEAHKRKTAFCDLIYLFDQSIKIQGTNDLGPLQKPYDKWKKDVGVIDCPKQKDLVPLPK